MSANMELESQEEQQPNKPNPENKVRLKKLLLLLSCVLLSIGNTGGPLLLRLYFIHGGKRVWLSCWLETGGWPIMAIPLLASFLYRKKKAKGNVTVSYITPFLFIAGAVLGVLTGLDDYLYAYAVSKLPVSTSSIIVSTHLGFTAVFAFLIVKQKLTPYIINAIVLLTVASVVLGIHSSNDRPKNETDIQYYTGFCMMLAAAALYGFVLPMVEYTCKKSEMEMSYALVIEMQMVMSFFATAFCTIGMLVNKDFQAIPREAEAYGLGEEMYYIVLVLNAIAWQCWFLGAIGIIFCASSLFSGVVIAALLPLTECLAVIFYHDKFSAEKGVSLALSLWGFASYFYGEIKESRRIDGITQTETNSTPHNDNPVI